jgi:hypothetical protein
LFVAYILDHKKIIHGQKLKKHEIMYVKLLTKLVVVCCSRHAIHVYPIQYMAFFNSIKTKKLISFRCIRSFSNQNKEFEKIFSQVNKKVTSRLK